MRVMAGILSVSLPGFGGGVDSSTAVPWSSTMALAEKTLLVPVVDFDL